jgi:MFS family permease
MNNVQHIVPAQAGVILLCVPLGMGVMGILGGYLTDRYGAKPFVLTGSGLLLASLLLLTLIVQSPTSELDLALRLLLIGMGIGLFTSPNQTRFMSVGARETMGAASALSNLVARLGTVCGPLLVGLVWTFLASESAQMGVGILLIDGFAVPNLLFAWLSIQRRARGVSTEEEPETISKKSHAEALRGELTIELKLGTIAGI